MEKLKMHSPNLAEGNIAKLAELFPNCVTESQDEQGNLKRSIDFDLLRQELSENIVEGPQERYHLNWPGKREALLTTNAPIAKTLRPCREESVDFDNTRNLFIEGDNLDALKLLQETYLGKVKLIYIDPPYNTGSDFIYEDDFSESVEEFKRRSNETDQFGNRLVANSDSNGRFHSDWLSMMYPRLRVAKRLLSEEGLIAVSIGDRELSNLLSLMSELFGDKSQVGIFTWKSRAKPTNAGDAKFRTQRVAEYVVVYGIKPSDQILLNAISAKVRTYPHADNAGKYRTTTILTSNRGMFRRETMRFEAGGFSPDEDVRWKAGKAVIEGLLERNRIAFNEDGTPVEKKYEAEENDPLYPIYSFIDPDLSGTAEHGKADLNELIGNQHGLDTVKPVLLLKYLVSTFSQPGDLILDFFAGSGTIAQSIFELNLEQEHDRQFILIQIPEKVEVGEFSTISDITKARLRACGELVRKSSGLNSQLFSERAKGVDFGFRVLRVDTSNMTDVYYYPDGIEQNQLKMFTENIKSDRATEDLLFQVLLDWGVDLSLPIAREKISGNEVFFVDGNALAASFVSNGEISEDFVKLLAERQPLRVVFRDAGFKDDSVKINVEQIFKLKSPHTDIKTI